MTDSIKYVTYCRVSTKKQGDSGLGLEAQQRDIQLFLDNYSGKPYEVLTEFVEIESGSNSEREELHQAIALARREKAVLLVAKLDRLSRKVSFIAQIMEDKQLNFKVAQMPHADNFQLHIYAALAEQERDFISKRTKAALQEAKARGVKLGGLRDKTNERNKAKKEKALAEAKKYHSIIGPLRKQGGSFSTIAEALNSSGLKTQRGGDFKAMTVKRIVDRLGL
jgi:DNA invertase Pin-like site-specific DNA recombinase